MAVIEDKSFENKVILEGPNEKTWNRDGFSISLKDIGANPSNFTNPVIPTIKTLYTTIDKSIYRDFIIFYGKVYCLNSYLSKESLLLNLYFTRLS